MNLRSLYSITNDNEKLIEFLIERRLIPIRRKCSCGSYQVISVGGKTEMNYRYRCPRPCRKETSLLKNTFFENTKLKIGNLLEFIYFWANEISSFKFSKHEIGISENPFAAWKSYMQDICIETLSKEEEMIGGEGIEVQIDKSLFSKRKNNQGRILPGEWGFGGD